MGGPGSGPRKQLASGNEITRPESSFLVARDAEEMTAATTRLASWFTTKCAELQAELDELTEARKYAKAHKWRVTAFDAAIRRAESRRLFYGKCGEAVAAGYALIPDLPCELVAIRTSQELPEGYRESTWGRPTPPVQECEVLGALEGEYVSPTPMVRHDQHTRTKSDGKTQETVKTCEAIAFKDPLFPVKVAHPALLTAAAKAMALKLFDEIGISPPYSRKAKDPAIVGRIHLPGSGHAMTFLIAWYLNLKDLP